MLKWFSRSNFISLSPHPRYFLTIIFLTTVAKLLFELSGHNNFIINILDYNQSVTFPIISKTRYVGERECHVLPLWWPQYDWPEQVWWPTLHNTAPTPPETQLEWWFVTKSKQYQPHPNKLGPCSLG